MAMVEVELWKQLMLAIDRGNEEAVKEVLAAADAVSCYSHLIGRTTKYGNTALHKACAVGNPQAVELLLRQGASKTDITTQMSATNKNGWTPMHEAAYGGHDKCVELLVAAGDRTAVCNDDGDDAISIATHKCHGWRIRAAIEHGMETLAAQSSVLKRWPSYQAQAPRVISGSMSTPLRVLTDSHTRTSQAGVTYTTLCLPTDQSGLHRGSVGFAGTPTRLSQTSRRKGSCLQPKFT
eukprot:m.10614 g.10614  ORF g.10614 m.10614 type:complete len:237 (+) comp7110_c0_seq1:62-772(+)